MLSRSHKRDVENLVRSLDYIETKAIGERENAGVTLPVLLCLSPKVPIPTHPNVLISGGVHGDESSGVFGALDFLRDDAPMYAERVNLFVLPCINPGGYEAVTLASPDGTNLNRVFGTDSDQPEVRAVESWLKAEGRQFVITLDLHETDPDYEGEGFAKKDNPRGCYIYETVDDKQRGVARALVDALPEDEICLWPEIYQDRATRGVVSYPEDNQNAIYAEKTTFDAFLREHYTAHSLTTETPSHWHLDRRASIQRQWVAMALDRILSG